MIRAYQKFKTLIELKVLLRIHYVAPITDGKEVKLPIGTEFFIPEWYIKDEEEEENLFVCIPANMQKIEELFVPQMDIASLKYDGVTIIITKDQIQNFCMVL